MRRSFAAIVRSAGVDVEAEYRSLHAILFGDYDFYSEMEYGFDSMPFKGTAASLDDFNRRHGFDFKSLSATRNEDDLLLLCEYVLSFAIHLTDWNIFERSVTVIEHVRAVAEKLMHRFVENEDGLCELVPIDSRILEAAEVAPEDVAVDLVRYDYRGLQGDLKGKRAILSKLCHALEPKRGELKKLAKDLESDLFYIANNFNIRHNNTDPAIPESTESASPKCS